MTKMTKTIYMWTSVELLFNDSTIDYPTANELSEEGWTPKQTEVRYNHRSGSMCAYTLWEKEVSKYE